jgi:hypothetical protein
MVTAVATTAVRVLVLVTVTVVVIVVVTRVKYSTVITPFLRSIPTTRVSTLWLTSTSPHSTLLLNKLISRDKANHSSAYSSHSCGKEAKRKRKIGLEKLNYSVGCVATDKLYQP